MTDFFLGTKTTDLSLLERISLTFFCKSFRRWEFFRIFAEKLSWCVVTVWQRDVLVEVSKKELTSVLTDYLRFLHSFSLFYLFSLLILFRFYSSFKEVQIKLFVLRFLLKTFFFDFWLFFLVFRKSFLFDKIEVFRDMQRLWSLNLVLSLTRFDIERLC